MRDAIIIKAPDSNVQPIIYVDSIYEHYKDTDEDINAMVDNVIEIYRSSMENEVAKRDYSNTLDFQQVKDKIIPVLVNREKNEELLKTCVHRDFLGDLAVIYKIRVDKNAHITVSNEIFAQYPVTEDVLYETAITNVKDTYKCENIINTMMQLMNLQLEEEETLEEMMKEDLPEGNGMFTVTTSSKLYGAAVMLNEEFMAALGEKYGDIYIIPSSIHEILFVPATGDEEQGDFLRETIQDVNESALDAEEYLSDHAYLYRKGIGFIN